MDLITLNYSEITQAFMSFLSSRPQWYLDFGDRYYSVDSSNIMRLHNNGDYNLLSSDEGAIDRSLIKFVVNDDYEATKTFDNVSYTADFSENLNLSNILFKTKEQTSNYVSSIERREDTYKFSIPRSNQNTTFADRMRGKYLISSYQYVGDGEKFTLPYIKTTYRYSMI